MRWLVALLMLAPMGSAVAVDAGNVEFAFYRDEGIAEYVLSADPDAPYSVGSWGNANNYVNTGREWRFFFLDLDGPFRLDASGSMQIEVFVGGGAQEAGRANVNWQLIVDGSVAAQGAAKEIIYTQSMERVSWTVTAPDVVIDNGDSLRVFTTGHIGKGARMNLAPSSTILPVLEGTPPPAVEGVATVYENVTGMPLQRTFANATGASVLNWTVETNGTLELQWHLTAGSMHLQAVGPGNETLFDQRLNGTGAAIIGDLLPGLWRLSLDAQNATGNITLHTLNVESGHAGPHADEDHDAEHVHAGGEGQDKDSPLPVVVLLLGLLVAARRRRSGPA